jgi:hypothetical protein
MWIMLAQKIASTVAGTPGQCVGQALAPRRNRRQRTRVAVAGLPLPPGQRRGKVGGVLAGTACDLQRQAARGQQAQQLGQDRRAVALGGGAVPACISVHLSCSTALRATRDV